MPNARTQRGFSLVEIAIAVTVIGLVLSALLPLLLNQQINSRITATRSKQESIKTALTTYVGRNSRLPCPALPAPTNANGPNAVGREEINVANGTCGTNVAITNAIGDAAVGVLPWKDLGLPLESVQDAYGDFFTYAVTVAASFTVPEGLAFTEEEDAALNAAGAVRRSVSALPGVIHVYNTRNPLDCTTHVAERLAAVVISHGPNGAGAWLPSGARKANPGTNTDERVNAKAAGETPQFVMHDLTPDFDDMLVWLSPDDILTPLAQTGSARTPRAALDARFQRLIRQVAKLARANGNNVPDIATVNASLATTQAEQRAPWGAVISYTPNPGNNSFTLSAIGPPALPNPECDNGGVAPATISRVVTSTEWSLVP